MLTFSTVEVYTQLHHIGFDFCWLPVVGMHLTFLRFLIHNNSTKHIHQIAIQMNRAVWLKGVMRSVSLIWTAQNELIDWLDGFLGEWKSNKDIFIGRTANWNKHNVITKYHHELYEVRN